MSILDEIYQEVILDHYKNPRCKGCLENPDGRCTLYNPLCGDQVDVTISIQDDTIVDIAFSGHGCSISQASASMMSDLCKGRKVREVLNLCGLFKEMMRGSKEESEIEDLGDAAALQGVRKFSARVKCAMLAWEAVEKCMLKPECGSSGA